MAARTRIEIGVLGKGLGGLEAATAFATRFPDSSITVIDTNRGPRTSDVAAGVVEPMFAFTEAARRQGRLIYGAYPKWISRSEQFPSLVTAQESWTVSRSEITRPEWLRRMRGARTLHSDELWGDFRDGVAYQCATVDIPGWLLKLEADLRARGVKFKTQDHPVESMAQLVKIYQEINAGSRPSVVIDASSTGSPFFRGSVTGKQGYLLHCPVPPAQLDHSIFFWDDPQPAYIILRPGSIGIVGGTATTVDTRPSEWPSTVDRRIDWSIPELSDILARAQQLAPGNTFLTQSAMKAMACGVRPYSEQRFLGERTVADGILVLGMGVYGGQGTLTCAAAEALAREFERTLGLTRGMELMPLQLPVSI